MGSFFNIFKSTPKPTFETELGTFTRVYSKRHKNIWALTLSTGVHLTVRGTETEPTPDQLDHVKNWSQNIQQLDSKITKKFKREFSEAGLECNFTDWKTRFKLVSVEVIDVLENDDLWSATFEDQQEPFAQFTIFIEDGKINSDFSIDT